MLIKFGLLKSGNLMNWWKIEQGGLLYSHSTRTDSVENDKMNSYTEAETEMSLESSSFLHSVEWSSAKEAEPILKRCNERQRQTLCDMSECLCLPHYKHLYSWLKTSSDNLHSNTNTEDLTLKQMFDISEKLITEQSGEIYGVKQLTGKTLHGNICLWLVMNKSSVFIAQESTYFQILYFVLERWARTHTDILHGKTDWRGSKVHQDTELWTKLMVSQWNSSGISSQDSPHCNSAAKFKSYFQDRA